MVANQKHLYIQVSALHIVKRVILECLALLNIWGPKTHKSAQRSHSINKQEVAPLWLHRLQRPDPFLGKERVYKATDERFWVQVCLKPIGVAAIDSLPRLCKADKHPVGWAAWASPVLGPLRVWSTKNAVDLASDLDPTKQY